ncbi:MAG TPA: type II secretion system protein GspD, partial [Candidatus Tenderia electrophaga]|nr:type II secretion system protein GspD [Candidatus Tenderia electrophaga]
SNENAADLITNTRSIKTSVLVDDGGTIVLGGLIQDDVQESVQKVPLLGDIPFLGALFRNKSTAKIKKNLLVFIRPSIVRDGAVATRITSSKYNYIRAEQVRFNEKGVMLMGDAELPLMPDFLELPPPFEPTQTGDPQSIEISGDGQ